MTNKMHAIEAAGSHTPVARSGLDAATTNAPSPHKMTLVLFVVVFALVSLLTPVIGALMGGAPPTVQLAVGVALQVGLMTYVIMPRVTRLLAWWLFPRPR